MINTQAAELDRASDLVDGEEAVSPYAPRALVVETSAISEEDKHLIIDSHRLSTHVMHKREEEERDRK